MRILTETEFGVVVGGGPPPAPNPMDDPTGMRRPWESPGVSRPFASLSEEGGGDEGGDKGKPQGETPAEKREGETEQLKDNAQTAANNCQYGIKRVSLTDFECQPSPSQNQSDG